MTVASIVSTPGCQSRDRVGTPNPADSELARMSRWMSTSEHFLQTDVGAMSPLRLGADAWLTVSSSFRWPIPKSTPFPFFRFWGLSYPCHTVLGPQVHAIAAMWLADLSLSSHTLSKASRSLEAGCLQGSSLATKENSGEGSSSFRRMRGNTGYCLHGCSTQRRSFLS